MRKFTDFIINKRHLILSIFIIFTIISGVLSSKVNINYDITKYLPSTSETRIGMDLMEKEFKEIKSSSLNLMLESLPEDKKTEIYDELTKIEGVSSVDYDENEKYNKDKYTLYVINVDDKEDSALATNIYHNIKDKYQDYTIYTSGSIDERNNPVLPISIVVLAVVSAMVILIIMCESYVEPFLFLVSILIAVVLNNGTNIMFKSVSNITSSISAILQMALSMDYSIMLMNRYEQERKNEKDKVKAMKNALHGAFSSISSSSITTIVGLLALVFMSFTIGRDLGLVLAKGVLFSLISIFFVLPSLILIFDKWIRKTKKKSPNFKVNTLGKISYKLRHGALTLFVLIFSACFLIKGNLGISYTDKSSNEVNKVFKDNNEMALIYNNKDEEKVAKFLKKIEKEEKVDTVLGYGNTINERLTYDLLNSKLNDLGTKTNVEDYLLKIIYYNYYNKDENNVLSFEEFVNFIKEDVYHNENIKINNELKTSIDKLANFTNSKEINKKRTPKELANILNIDEENIQDLLIYYNSKNNNLKISLNDFLKFMNAYVLTSEKYGKNFNKETKDNLNNLAKFTDINFLNKKMTSKEMALIFEIPENLMNDLYNYYISINTSDTKMTLNEFSNFVLNDVLNNPNFASNFTEEMLNNLKILQTFSNLNLINKNMNSKKLASIFNIDEQIIKELMLFKYSKVDSGFSLSIKEFINKTIYLKDNTNYLDQVDISNIKKLEIFTNNDNNTKMSKEILTNLFSKELVDTVYTVGNLSDTYLMTPKEFVYYCLDNLKLDENTKNNLIIIKSIMEENKYSATELAKILNINLNQVYSIYALINLDNLYLTPRELVTLILDNQNNEMLKNYLNEEALAKLKFLVSIMDSSINNISFSSQDLAEFIKINEETIKNIYTLYNIKNTNLKLTPKEFVDFVLTHKNAEVLANKIDNNTLNKLNLLQTVMNASLNNKKYSSGELSKILGINNSDLSLLYGLYTSKYINNTISLKEFVNFILNDVIKNPVYSKNFNNDAKTSLNTINGIMNASLNNKKYTKNEILGILSNLTKDIDKDEVDLLYIYYGSSREYNKEWTLTVEEFINYLNDNILSDKRFDDFIESDMRQSIRKAKDKIKDAKELLIGNGYTRAIINTKLDPESKETFDFIEKTKNELENNIDNFYLIGDSLMAYEMSKTFQNELNFITIITMIAIFIVVALTFKSLIIPLILVLIIQCAVYMVMGILAFTGDNVYFIALLIVQSILMGATIDYAIVYTSYYINSRKTMNVKEAIINSYNKAIHTILTSASILIIVTLVVGYFASAVAARICKTISQGTLCSTILIIVLLPAILASVDKFIIKKNKIG